QGVWQEEIAVSGAPNPRHEAGFVKVGNKFYLLGGRGIKAVDIYDPISKSWTQGQAPPIEIHHFQPLEYQGKIYGIGAMTGPYPNETAIPNIIIYDPALDQWSTGPEIPANRRRGGAGLVLLDGIFYLVCGIINGHSSGHVNWMDSYNPETDSWQVLADAPRARDHFQASELDGKIYALGGRRSVSTQDVFGNTEKKVDVYDIASNQWTTLNLDLPTERAGTYNAVLGKEILVLGGESSFQNPAYSEVEALDTRTGSWRNMATMIQGRHGTGAIWFQDTLFIASGSGNRGGGPELASIEKFYFRKRTTSILTLSEKSPFRIYPNPTSSKEIRIDYDGPLRAISIELFTPSGQLMAQEDNLNQFPFDWNVQEAKLESGFYILRIGTPDQQFSQKILLK
ncbi:MAG: T9SS type A sorting domain-containing protein, partial [Bacteroidota bacterium]